MYRSMNIKSLSVAISALVLSTSVNAAFISISNTNTSLGNGSTADLQGLEWLSFNDTLGMSRTDVTSGGFLSSIEGGGWRYASRNETETLFRSLKVTTAGYYLEVNNVGVSWLFNNFGGLYAENTYDGDMDGVPASSLHGYARILFGAEYTGYWGAFSPVITVYESQIVDGNSYDSTIGASFVNAYASSIGGIGLSQATSMNASLLVRETVVPVPAAVWLFGSGLIGLIGLARRKTA